MNEIELRDRIRELETELATTNRLLEEREKLLSAIPECPAHGKCIPHAVEWIEQVKTLGKIISGT